MPGVIVVNAVTLSVVAPEHMFEWHKKITTTSFCRSVKGVLLLEIKFKVNLTLKGFFA
jgi:hypothetical protein